MTEKELAAIKARHAEDDQCGYVVGGWWYQAHADRGALLAHVADLEAVLHDALQEGGVELGKHLGRGEALACLEATRALWGGSPGCLGDWRSALGDARSRLTALGPARDPPPAAVRAENEALRRHLEACVGALGGAVPGGRLLSEAQAAARAYLRGEGTAAPVAGTGDSGVP